MAKCLVVGANGFLGSHLTDELVARGHEVSVFDRFSVPEPAFESAGVRSFVGDFMNRADVAAALEGQQYVFHFVSTTTPVSAENDPSMDARTNIASSIDLLELSVAAGVQKVFFASTGGAIYGDQPGPLTELALPQPVSPYAIGKLAIEGYLHYFHRKHGLDSVAFRISNPYGPRQRERKLQGVIPIFLRQIQDGHPVTVYGDGSMVRDYVFASDVVQMIADTIGKPTEHSVYNIGSGIGTTVLELLQAMSAVTGRDPVIEHTPAPATFLERAVLDTGRFTAEFGSRPLVDLHQGIDLTWRAIMAEQA